MVITVARQIGVRLNNLLELEIFFATQALLDIGLRVAVSRRQYLVQNLHRYRQRLEAELAARRALTGQPIRTGENTCESPARELHDETGRDITVIQIQSQLTERVPGSE